MLSISVPVRRDFSAWPSELATREDWHVLMLIDGQRQLYDIARLLNLSLPRVFSVFSRLQELGLAKTHDVYPAQMTTLQTSRETYRPVKPLQSDTQIVRAFRSKFPGFHVSKRIIAYFVKQTKRLVR